MVSKRALAAQILVIYHVSGAPKLATFSDPTGALYDPRCVTAAIVPTVLCLAPLLKEWAASRKRPRHPLLPNRL
jgi:hypothetical protein